MSISQNAISSPVQRPVRRSLHSLGSFESAAVVEFFRGLLPLRFLIDLTEPSSWETTEFFLLRPRLSAALEEVKAADFLASSISLKFMAKREKPVVGARQLGHI